MSGVKEYPVTLTNIERDRMMNSCRIAGDQARANQIAMQQMKEAENILSHRVDGMDQKFKKEINGMSVEMQRIERAQNESLRKQAQNFMQALSNQHGEIMQTINQQRKEINQALSTQKRELEGQIQSVIVSIQQKEQNHKKQAELWIQDVSLMLQNIDEEYRHEQFKPGGLAKLRQELSMGKTNNQNGVPEAAISTAQNVYMRATDYKFELVVLELEWEASLAATKQSLISALTSINVQEDCRFTFETETGDVSVDGDVNMWTCGKLSANKVKIDEIANRLKTPDALSTEQLELLNEQLMIIRAETDSLGDYAKEALIASQIRVNIADNILGALEDAGWKLEDSTYNCEDMREAYNVKLTNGLGDEIVAIINPRESLNHLISNELIINFFDESTNDEKVRSSHLHSITSALDNNGLVCGDPKCKEGYENRPSDNEKLRDFENIRKQGVQMN